MKNWKNLFVKQDDEEVEKSQPASTQPENFSFPVYNNPQATAPDTTAPILPDAVNEVLSVYEKGIDSINMPGYDFYEFYKAISSIHGANEQVYTMAFRMAKSMDATITSQKLITDADFYISKINEVHSQYHLQGEQKINTLTNKRNEDKRKLSQEIDLAAQQVIQLRSQLQVLENEIMQKRNVLASIDNEYQPQENTVRQKLMANDSARQISVTKLTAVKEGIQQYVK